MLGIISAFVGLALRFSSNRTIPTTIEKCLLTHALNNLALASYFFQVFFVFDKAVATSGFCEIKVIDVSWKTDDNITKFV